MDTMMRQSALPHRNPGLCLSSITPISGERRVKMQDKRLTKHPMKIAHDTFSKDGHIKISDEAMYIAYRR